MASTKPRLLKVPSLPPRSGPQQENCLVKAIKDSSKALACNKHGTIFFSEHIDTVEFEFTQIQSIRVTMQYK